MVTKADRQQSELRNGRSTAIQDRSVCVIGRGFTLIELLVVLSIIALLLTLAVPRYFHSIDTSKEAVLAENLQVVRETIDKFYGDKGRYPDSLEELVSERYLRSLPYDPITGNASTWTIIAPEAPGAKGNVFDIKSGASGTASDGKSFTER
jgi:general secretion pathway protein G